MVSTFSLLTCGKCHSVEATVVSEVMNELRHHIGGGFTDGAFISSCSVRAPQCA